MKTYKCVNPNCDGVMAAVDDEIFLCDKCGTAVNEDQLEKWPTPEKANTDYRDRVERIVAAAVSGYMANSGAYFVWDHRQAISEAMHQIDAIDAAIAEMNK